MILEEESFAFLRLHREYHLSDHLSRKLIQQYCEPFWIQRRVSRLAYKMKLSAHWRIHPVIFIAQLESASKEANSYNRSRSSHSNSILVEGDIKKWASYEIDRLVNKRLRRYGRESVIKEYLVRWKEYESEYDEWYDEDLLNNASELVINYDIAHPKSNTRERRERGRISEMVSNKRFLDVYV